ncbi:MAG TPA: hypothetical protein VKO67_10185 [Smithellaceae bacterium]|nr:hypothetical protein [Smithellaceae bacterium]
MKCIAALSFVGLFLVSLFVASSATACTVFSISFGQKVFFAGNEDQRPQNSASWLFVDKRGSLGVVFFATPWEKWPIVMEAGINEKGLCYDQNWIPAEKLKNHPEKILAKDHPSWELMRECATVEDVLAKFRRYNWGGHWGGIIDFQIHFADKTGDAVVLFPDKNGEMTYVRKPKNNSYLVSSNFNVRLMPEGDFSKSLSWVGWDRYNTADKMLARIKSEKDLSVQTAAAVLDAAHQPEGSRSSTIYSELYDPQNLRIYLFYNHQFDTAYVLDVADELAKTKGKLRRVPLKDLILDADVKKEKMK